MGKKNKKHTGTWGSSGPINSYWSEKKKKERLQSIKLGQHPFVTHEFETKIEAIEAPNIIMSKEAFLDMGVLVALSDKEIGWLGMVDKINDSTYYIESIFLVDQQTSGSTTEILPEGLDSFMVEMMEKDPENYESINKRMRFWGHSHVTMGTHPSSQDLKQMEDFAHCEFFIMGIANRHKSIRFWLYLNHKGVLVKDVPWSVYDPDHHFDDRLKLLEDQIDVKVKNISYYANNFASFDDDSASFNTGYRIVRTGEVYSSLDDDDLEDAILEYETMREQDDLEQAMREYEVDDLDEED